MKQQATPIDPTDFSGYYSLLREKEGRLYDDEEVLCLPVVSASHRYFKEWQLRKQSAARLIRFFQNKKKQLKILEVGCGNGWLSHWMAAIHNSQVTGIDIHFREIQQAAKVFGSIENLHFMYGDIRTGIFKEKQFDIIVFAASIQYFASLPEIVTLALNLLNENGEIHILDSHLYHPGESATAKYHTQEYFSKLGLPAMSSWYHHHLLTDLEEFHYKILYKPSPVLFFKKQNPFPWIVVKSKTHI